MCAQARSAATLAASCAGGGQAVTGVGDDQLALKLGQHGQHSEHGPTFGRGGIDALLDDVQAHA